MWNKLVSTFEVRAKSINPEIGDDFRFRIEVFNIHGGKFVCRMWRCEFFRIQPTFPMQNGEPLVSPADEILAVRDNFLLDETVVFDDENSVSRAVEAALKDKGLFAIT